MWVTEDTKVENEFNIRLVMNKNIMTLVTVF